jgi:hypothetical protein
VVETTEEDVVIFDDNGDELVYWHRQEWIEDPKLPTTIVNAVTLALTDPEQFLKTLNKG